MSFEKKLILYEYFQPNQSLDFIKYSYDKNKNLLLNFRHCNVGAIYTKYYVF